MEKRNQTWSIKELQAKFDDIEFPEFQREPTVWDLDRKCKLIDSILRNFDMGSIYLYARSDGSFDCIDGRQRINAIMSFLGLNEGEGEYSKKELHNRFVFKSSDDLLRRKDLVDYDGKTWDEFIPAQKQTFQKYSFNVIEISDADEEEDELNLMFLRLQLGVPLKGGEKLKAMVGAMRDLIFESKVSEPSLGQHSYFLDLQIPKRRFSRELTAAQVAINFFSLQRSGQYARSRFIDLQEFFKQYAKEFDQEDSRIVKLLRTRLTEAHEAIVEASLKIKNRAIGISVLFFLHKMIENAQKEQIPKFMDFLTLFLKTLKEQVEKGIDIDRRYRGLLNFQTYISQAAAEKYAIEDRQQFLDVYFAHYLRTSKIKTDEKLP
jgi:hypothetical protein